MIRTALSAAVVIGLAITTSASAKVSSGVFERTRVDAGLGREVPLANQSAFPSLTQVSYTQTSGTGLLSGLTTVPTALDDVGLIAGTSIFAPKLNILTFAASVAPNTAATTGVVFVDFYDTVNPLSPGIVESGYLGGFGGTLTITANTSATNRALRAFTFNNLSSLASPINFPDNDIGVVITFANATATAYSTILTTVSSNPGVPTVGSSTTGIWIDPANDDFTASDFVPTGGNLYLSMTTIPEPASLGLAALAGTLVIRRRKQA
jgi:hypothetical protein